MIIKRRTSFIPVQNDLNKAIAFANSLDNNNITQRQKIKQVDNYIQTVDVVKSLQTEGWQIRGVGEDRGRDKKIAHNYVQMIHPDFKVDYVGSKKRLGGEAVSSLNISNGCSGKDPLQMEMGSFRQVCSNGAVAFEETASKSIKHTEHNKHLLPMFINEMNEKAGILLNKIKHLQLIPMSPDQQRLFAEEALIKLLGKETATKLDMNDYLKVNRTEDQGDDVWTVFNRIQESITKHASSFASDIKMNKQLMELTMQYA
jgi:hypothetical protein